MPNVGVIYLYRFAEGMDSVRNFLQSYYDHTAGFPHDLHIIFKGFPDKKSLSYGRALFEKLPINCIEQTDIGHDVGSYIRAAQIVPNQRLLFLNTFSRILADHWLGHYHRALDLPGIGLVGSTGSWLANTSPYEARAKFIWERRVGWDWNRRDKSGHQRAFRGQRGAPLPRRHPYWRYLLAALEYPLKLYQYGRYPNPHIRTNAFMIEREHFLSLDFPHFRTKADVYKFESGRNSMTKQILRRNLKPVIVDCRGGIHHISQWRSSATFWIDAQRNLIIADNRTTEYANGDRTHQQRLQNLAWAHPRDWYSRPDTPL